MWMTFNCATLQHCNTPPTKLFSLTLSKTIFPSQEKKHLRIKPTRINTETKTLDSTNICLHLKTNSPVVSCNKSWTLNCDAHCTCHRHSADNLTHNNCRRWLHHTKISKLQTCVHTWCAALSFCILHIIILTVVHVRLCSIQLLDSHTFASCSLSLIKSFLVSFLCKKTVLC